MKKVSLHLVDFMCKDAGDPVICTARYLNREEFEEGDIIERLRKNFNLSHEEARKIT